MKPNGPIRWKYTARVSPPGSWWMNVPISWGNVTWGFKNQIDGSWVFKVGEYDDEAGGTRVLFRVTVRRVRRGEFGTGFGNFPRTK